MREKLKNLLKNAKYPLSEGYPAEAHLASQLSGKGLDYIADFLLENGVIVPPCKVGDTVYIPWEFGYTKGVAFSEVEKIVFYTPNVPRIFIKDLESDMPIPSNFCLDDFGKTVFLTREEAEQALKGGAK